jgi:hypothetical protein
VLEAKARSKAAEDAMKNLTIEEQGLKIAKDRLTHEERLKELDADIASAKRQGNKEELAALEAMKAYYLEFEASKERGLSIDQAITNANKARHNVIDGIIKKNQEEEKETRKIKENMISIKTVGDLIAKTKIAEPMKSFRERTNDAQKKVKEFADFLGGDFSRMSLFDLGKKLGIERTKNDAGKMLTDIEAKLKEISGRKLEIQIDKDMTKEELVELQRKIGATKGEAQINLKADGSISEIREELKKEIDLSLSSSKGGDYLNTISSAVETIRDLVKSLEKKLPMPALGA